jgi:DNA-binding response OmpR family regulator
MARHFDIAMRTQSILVIDPNAFHRAVAGEMLRSLGAGRVENAEDLAEAAALAQRFSPTIIVLEWDLDGSVDGIAYTKKIRRSETLFRCDVAIMMASAQASQASVETARIAGVDEYIIKPFSTGSLAARLESIVLNRREFIDCPEYVGPCRRRKLVVDYDGVRRRMSDKDETTKRKIALARIEELAKTAHNFVPGNSESLRNLHKGVTEITSAADLLDDTLLRMAANSLQAYVEGLGTSSALDTTVLKTHIDAMKQIAALPNAASELRAQVAHALQTLVDKKLAAKSA